MTKIYSTPIQALMAQLAGQANSSLMRSDNLNFPDRWDVLQYLDIPSSYSVINAQGFLAKGNIDPSDPNSKVVAALVLGIDWSTFLANMQYTAPNPVALPEAVTRKQNTDTVTMEKAFVDSYMAARPALWSALNTFLGTMDLYICGMGVGAPIAQLAALDLRPSTTPVGPGGEIPPPQQPLCYVYSAPNVSNDALVSFYNNSVVLNGAIATNTYWAKKPGLIVDFFPSAPDTGILGNSCAMNDVTLPNYDVPWLERGNIFYIKQLGGQLVDAPSIPAKYNYPPAFDQVMANNCAQFIATSYGQTQHQSGPSPSGYTLLCQVKANGSPFAFIFSNITNLVVAFRGTVTWKEALEITANSTGMLVSAYENAYVHSGAYNLYNSPTESGGSVIFKDELASAIRNNLGSRKLYFTGHDIGGSLANLTAIDYAVNTNIGLSPQQVYTFGAIPLGNISFSEFFDNAIGSKCFQIIRVFDRVASALLGAPAYYTPFTNSLVLNGQLSAEENTYHSIHGYLGLLDPTIKR